MERSTTVSLNLFILLHEKIMKKCTTNWKISNIETSVITKRNITQTALYNQKLSSFNIGSAPCYPHITFVKSVVTPLLPQEI